MTLIADTSITQLFEIEVTLTEDAPVEQGQGTFEIKPHSISIVWAKPNGERWQCSKVKTRGLRLDNESTGLRVWHPIDGDEMPPWVREIVLETSPRQES
jgi:hypothetical protein